MLFFGFACGVNHNQHATQTQAKKQNTILYAICWLLLGIGLSHNIYCRKNQPQKT